MVVIEYLLKILKMVEGLRMWAISLLTIVLLLPLLSAAPLDIAGDIKKVDVKTDNDGMHSHDENVTRGGKFFGHNQFDIRNINISGSVAGDVVSIGHQVKIDVQGHAHDHHHDEADSVIECKEGLRELFKSIDSNKNGLVDAKELLRVCHQNNLQITESLAVRILTLPDKTVGFNLAKFCELLKDCPSTNSADLIYFLLQLFDKGPLLSEDQPLGWTSSLLLGSTSTNNEDIDGGWSNWSEYRQCSKNCGGGQQTRTRTCTNPVPQHKGRTCEQQNIGDPTETKDCNLHDCVTCHYKDDLSSVLLENNWKTQDEIDVMSEEDKRNTVIVEVEKMTGHTTEDLQRRANAEDLGSLASIANMATFLIKYLIRSSSTVKTMTYEPHLRNTLIVETSKRFSTQISTLQSMTDHQLLKKFFEEGGKCGQCKCGQTDAEMQSPSRRRRNLPDGSSQVICPYKDDLSSVLLENNWKTQDEIDVMSEEDKRNAVIVEVEKMTDHTDLQGRANAGKLGSLTAIANMASLLIKYFIRSSTDVKTMTYNDLRKTLIIETSKRFLIPVSALQINDIQLLKKFCSVCTDCPADETLTSECMCGGKICASGGRCASGSRCIPVTCSYKDDLSSVLLENNWSTQDQINDLAEDDKRNLVITKVGQMTGHTTAELQGRADAGGLGSLTSIANMVSLLIKYSIKSSSDVKTMRAPDLRNALITETSRRFSIQVGTLQRKTDHQLLNTFCIRIVTCPHKDDLSSVLLENNWSTQDQINVMSEDHKRNLVITKVGQMTGHTTADLQGRASFGGLGSLTSIANMVSLLIKYSIKSSSDVKAMRAPDLRNALITETSRRFSIQVGTLQSKTDHQLLKTFCIIGTDRLLKGEKLIGEEFLRSQNGEYDLVMQSDGNLVVYMNLNNGRIKTYSTKTSSGAGSFLILQRDGNLVIYKVDGTKLWSTDKYSGSADSLVMQNDGNLVLYAANNVLWASHTGVPEVEFICPSGNKFTSKKVRVAERLKQSCRACWERADGCSAPGKIAAELNSRFRTSCDIHDLCYGYLGRSKDHCDKEFRYNMWKQCGSNLICRSLAAFAHKAVSVDATGHAKYGYTSGQKAAKTCILK